MSALRDRLTQAAHNFESQCVQTTAGHLRNHLDSDSQSDSVVSFDIGTLTDDSSTGALPSSHEPAQDNQRSETSMERPNSTRSHSARWSKSKLLPVSPINFPKTHVQQSCNLRKSKMTFKNLPANVLMLDVNSAQLNSLSAMSSISGLLGGTWATQGKF